MGYLGESSTFTLVFNSPLTAPIPLSLVYLICMSSECKSATSRRCFTLRLATSPPCIRTSFHIIHSSIPPQVYTKSIIRDSSKCPVISISQSICGFRSLYIQNCPKMMKSKSSVPALPISQLALRRTYCPYPLPHSPLSHPLHTSS